MDIRFAAKLQEAGPTQYEQGQILCIRLMETVDIHTANRTRYEDAITATYAVFTKLCEDAGYDSIGAAEVLSELLHKKR
jgi:hypothetical protein